MRPLFVLALLAGITAATGVPTLAWGTNIALPSEPSAMDRRLDRAYSFVRDGKAEEAISVLDELIYALESAHPLKAGIAYYSARSMNEAVAYSMLHTIKNDQDVYVTDRNWGESYFLKGFALIDAKRPREAIVWFDKAIALSPRNAHFLNERAEWYKMARDWDRAFAEFERAKKATEYSVADLKTSEKGRALRGMAFARVEQQRWADAEIYIREALALDPNDQRARDELKLIESNTIGSKT